MYNVLFRDTTSGILNWQSFPDKGYFDRQQDKGAFAGFSVENQGSSEEVGTTSREMSDACRQTPPELYVLNAARKLLAGEITPDEALLETSNAYALLSHPGWPESGK